MGYEIDMDNEAYRSAFFNSLLANLDGLVIIPLLEIGRCTSVI